MHGTPRLGALGKVSPPIWTVYGLSTGKACQGPDRDPCWNEIAFVQNKNKILMGFLQTCVSNN